tara:strand:- start:7812 stop:8006 length:195 start_codon:yes stop_codon:yes gene_type:complete
MDNKPTTIGDKQELIENMNKLYLAERTEKEWLLKQMVDILYNPFSLTSKDEIRTQILKELKELK